LQAIYVDDKHKNHPQLKQACNRRNRVMLNFRLHLNLYSTAVNTLF